MTETKHLIIDESDLLAAMEQNFAEHACHLHRHMAGTTVTETHDLLIADSGLDDDSYNIVAAARFTPDTALARITETIRKLAATGRPFSWHLGPASTPPDLAAHLEAADLEASETEIAMRKDLSEARAGWADAGMALPWRSDFARLPERDAEDRQRSAGLAIRALRTLAGSDREVAWSDGGRSGGRALIQRLQRQPDGGVELRIAARGPVVRRDCHLDVRIHAVVLQHPADAGKPIGVLRLRHHGPID
jgi:hypothetical protein